MLGQIILCACVTPNAALYQCRIYRKRIPLRRGCELICFAILASKSSIRQCLGYQLRRRHDFNPE